MCTDTPELRYNLLTTAATITWIVFRFCIWFSVCAFRILDRCQGFEFMYLFIVYLRQGFKCFCTITYLFRRKLQCQMVWNDNFLWKNHSFQLNTPWGWSTFHRIQYRRVDCLLRRHVWRCHVLNQKWVRKRNMCTLRVAGFGIVSASQDCILWCC